MRVRAAFRRRRRPEPAQESKEHAKQLKRRSKQERAGVVADATRSNHRYRRGSFRGAQRAASATSAFSM
eukprot:855867-Pleurochrysis_carterae.AAC.2